MKRLLCMVAACGLTLLGIAAARAQAYPNNKPITIITAFGPGSASDTITRVLAQPLGIALKTNVIVEARPGANGSLSALYVARAAPDGHTLLMTTNSPHSASLKIPTRRNARAYACDPRQSASSNRLSKCSEPENRSKTSEGPPSNRPPHSFICPVSRPALARESAARSG